MAPRSPAPAGARRAALRDHHHVTARRRRDSRRHRNCRRDGWQKESTAERSTSKAVHRLHQRRHRRTLVTARFVTVVPSQVPTQRIRHRALTSGSRTNHDIEHANLSVGDTGRGRPRSHSRTRSMMTPGPQATNPLHSDEVYVTQVAGCPGVRPACFQHGCDGQGAHRLGRRRQAEEVRRALRQPGLANDTLTATATIDGLRKRTAFRGLLRRRRQPERQPVVPEPRPH